MQACLERNALMLQEATEIAYEFLRWAATINGVTGTLSKSPLSVLAELLHVVVRYGQAYCALIMAALCNRGPLYFCPVISIYRLSSFFSSPNLSGRRLDVYHTLTHGVALVRI